MKQSPKLPAEKRRAQLIRAAKKVLIRKGYNGATTAEIARAAGLTKGALYFHFSNKEDIFFAVVRDVSKRQFDLMTESLMNEPNPDRALEKLIRTAFELVEERKYFSLEFWQQAKRVRKIRNFLDSQQKKMEKQLTDYLKKHRGIKSRDSKSLFMLLHVIFDGIIIRQQCCIDEINLNHLKKDVIKMTRLYLRER